MTTSLFWFLMAWADKSIMTLSRSTSSDGAMPQDRFTHLDFSVGRPRNPLPVGCSAARDGPWIAARCRASGPCPQAAADGCGTPLGKTRRDGLRTHPTQLDGPCWACRSAPPPPAGVGAFAGNPGRPPRPSAATTQPNCTPRQNTPAPPQAPPYGAPFGGRPG